MQIIRTVAAACAAFWLLGAVPPARADPPTVADFLEGPALSAASLSPSGRYLVWTVHEGDESAVHIRDLQEGTVSILGAGSNREHFGGVFVDWIRWKTDDRLLIGLTRLELRRFRGREDGSVRSFTFGQSVLSLGRDGSDMVALKAPGAEDAAPGDVLDTLRDDPDHILMSYRDRHDRLNVARVNILTGEAARTVEGHRRVLDYITDRNGAVVGRIAYRGATGRIMLMEALNPDGAWSEVFRLRRNEISRPARLRVPRRHGPAGQDLCRGSAGRPRWREHRRRAHLRLHHPNDGADHLAQPPLRRFRDRAGRGHP